MFLEPWPNVSGFRGPMRLEYAEIISELDTYGISAERKSLYKDFELLRQFGLDIEMTKSKTTGYFIASRDFELSDLKLLVNAVQSVDFISDEKAEELISKLSLLTSKNQAKTLEEIIKSKEV
jgi:predicted DNA-binding transcriptional regulator YafY